MLLIIIFTFTTFILAPLGKQYYCNNSLENLSNYKICKEAHIKESNIDYEVDEADDQMDVARLSSFIFYIFVKVSEVSYHDAKRTANHHYRS